MKKQLIQIALAASLALASTSAVLAQTFPSRPITLIAPWPAGGSSDAILRAFAESASKQLGQPVIGLNKPGAGGILGAAEMANAEPEGYTIALLPLGVLRVLLDWLYLSAVSVANKSAGVLRGLLDWLYLWPSRACGLTAANRG